MAEVRYPNIKVRLSSEDKNAYAILARVMGAMRRANLPQSTIEEYHASATSDDYQHLLHITTKWVTCS